MLNLRPGSLTVYRAPARLCLYEARDRGVGRSPFVSKDKLLFVHTRHQ